MKDNLLGCRFGRLVVLAPGIPVREGKAGQLRKRWLCRCDCGAEKLIRESGLKSGNTKSCGCLKRDPLYSGRFKHGQSQGKGENTREYRSWQHAKTRCFNQKDSKYADYGGRGITMCDRWADSFEAFFADMGVCPTGFTLDRKDTNGHYEPGNCRWASAETQAQNRRNNVQVVYEGQVFVLTELARQLGLNFWSLRHYVCLRGLPIERAVQKAKPAERTT